MVILKLYSDNHYAEVLDSIDKTDLAWLAGIIDGEGSVSCQATIRKNGNLILVPFVTVVNSDDLIINKVTEILNKVNIHHTWYQRKTNVTRKTHDNQEIKTVTITDNTSNLRVEKMSRVDLLLRLVCPYLFSIKRHKAEIMIEWIKLRNERLLNRDEKTGQIVRNKYSRKEIEMLAQVRTSWSAKPIEELLKCPNVEQE